MLLFYSHTSTVRLQYTCSFILKELLGLEYEICIDPERFRLHEGPNLNYSNAQIGEKEFFIQSHHLLFEEGTRDQQVDVFTAFDNKAFFRTQEGDLPFDIFAAAFYLLSRYEEYLPHDKDLYGRYACENSFAYKYNTLHLPLINLWVKEFARVMKLKFPSIIYKQPAFQFQPTYDIDIAYSYKYKGLLRNIGGFLKAPSKERLLVLAGKQEDPFDCYEYLQQLHERFGLDPIYFFLAAEQNSRFDKNILPHKDAMIQLVKRHAAKHRVGLHPSWHSGDDRSLLRKEKEQLEYMCDRRVTMSRQHYIRFNLPEGYQRLIAAGITDDYSMGYGTSNGFRASVASSFFWYDLEKEQQTSMRIHPFCFMDANAFYEQKQKAAESLEELLRYMEICKEVNGTLITIWHNNFLGRSAMFQEWRTAYEQFIAQVRQ
jgi:hypothetical protein